MASAFASHIVAKYLSEVLGWSVRCVGPGIADKVKPLQKKLGSCFY